MIEKEQVLIPIDGIKLDGDLSVPKNTKSLVIFAHGSGSSRLSPRNIQVADKLNDDDIATLLVDLLTTKEDEDYNKRFDIDLLAERLIAITDWATHYESTKQLTIGYFGASTGAAASIIAASGASDVVKALVSRGGRVDLARSVIDILSPPTLLIVGEEDNDILEVNESYYEELRCVKDLYIVPTATHLFEEPGTLEKVAELASAWFSKYL